MNLTVREAARMLNVPEETVYRWIREKEIPVHRIGDQYRFHRSELLEWATTRGVRISSAQFQHSDDEDRPPSLADAISVGGVHSNVGGDDRESVLHNIVQLLPIDDGDRELIMDFLMAREALGSTGIGDGIAIPHVRNPVVLHVPHPTITVCFLPKPVEFDAIDGKPVTTVFLLVTPTVRSHLYLLSRLSAALMDPIFKEAIVNRASATEIVAEAKRVEGSLSQRMPAVKV
jgi:PTS system nitrogen regulatory IIA component